MTKTLVAYYSWTGHTAQVAREIAAKLGADVEAIRDANPRSGGKGNLRSVFEVLFKRTPPILPAERAASDHELVILGCPVWAQGMASPMRAYVERERDGIGRLAVFCTEGGMGGDKVNRAVAKLCGREAIADLVVTETDLASGDWRALADTFVREIQAANGEEVTHQAGAARA